ncbi:MAG TPA: hypothetical protein VND64_16180, partial [Pirellulales bacterium]|nr:hypothetical protein [Pirellulales bacterium]
MFDRAGNPVADALVIVAKGPENFRAMREGARAGKSTESITLATTNSDGLGRFTVTLQVDALDDWPAPALSLWVVRDGFSLEVRRLAADWPGVAPLRLTLAPTERVDLRLAAPDGIPAAGASVTPEWVRGALVPADLAERLRVTVGDDANASMSGVKPGDLKTIRVQTGSYGTQWLAMPNTPAKRATLSLVAVGQISGHIAG